MRFPKKVLGNANLSCTVGSIEGATPTDKPQTKIKTTMNYSAYTVTVKTDCSYWGDGTDRESAGELACEHGAKIESALPGINVRYCDMIGHGNADNTDGPDGDVCEEIDRVVSSLM